MRDASSTPMAEPGAWPAGGGRMVDLVRAHDWTRTPLGPLDRWPQSLRTAVDIVLSSDQPMQLAWGTERSVIYNDAFAGLLGERHPRALGAPLADVLAEEWRDLAPVVGRVEQGRAARHESAASGAAFSISPLRDGEGAVAGDRPA